MDFHRRFNEDGSCEIICMHCFQTAGIVKGHSAARTIEMAHICIPDPISDVSAEYRAFKNSSPDEHIPAILQKLPLLLVSVMVVVFLYALPTAIEWIVSRQINPWVGSIVLGDMVGCICLATVFKMPRTGVLLYLLLTVGEALLYRSHRISATTLLWVVDMVPALVVTALIARHRWTESHQRVLA